MFNISEPSLFLFELAIAIFIATAILTLVFHKSEQQSRFFGGCGSALGSAVFFILGLRLVLLAEHVYAPKSAVALPFIRFFGDGALLFDHFNGIFFVLLGFIGIAASIYAMGYSRLHAKEHAISWLFAMTALFIGSMGMVLAANHSLTFLFAWELMTLTSFALVVYQHEKPEVTRAGFLYLVTTHIATACLLAAFTLIGQAENSFLFSDWANIASVLTPGLATFSFALLFVGFAIKAGLVPFHIWLPEAHPQAPTHISALMSGVMIKIAIYAFLRLVFTGFWENMEPWWGLVIMTFGALSAVVGVFYAIERRDMKKALAFSSIENIGIIFIGLGAAFYFNATGNVVLAIMGLAAALLHIVNHALLKSLLFLGAGNVYYRHHTRSMDFLGGVAKTLPLTSVVFLLGAIGMMGLPPMNGFASEWLMFQALLNGLSETTVGTRLLFPIIISALAFAAGLAFVVFSRMFGMVFLGRERSPQEHTQTEKGIPLSMTIGTLIPAVGAIGVALGMKTILEHLLVQIIPTFSGDKITIAPDPSWGVAASLAFPEFSNIFGANAWLAIILLFVCGFVAWLFMRLVGGKTKTITGPSWDCGVPLNERMQYSGLGFTSPIRHALRVFTRPKEIVETVQGPDNFYFWHVRKYSVTTLAIFDVTIIQPFSRLMFILGSHIRRVQGGLLSVYIAYIAATLLLFLFLSRLL